MRTFHNPNEHPFRHLSIVQRLDRKHPLKLHEHLYRYGDRNFLQRDQQFFQEVFSRAEKGRSGTSLVKNQGINEFRINSGADTYDRVFLLSVDEARAYFKDANDRLVQPTPYAKRHGTWAGTYSGNTWWWLRTRGRFTNHFAYVDNETDIRVKGLAGSNYYGAVRPALWFNLKDLKNESLKTK